MPAAAKAATKAKISATAQPALSLLLLLLAGPSGSLACERLHFGEPGQLNIACQCNATHCDRFGPFDWPTQPGVYLRVSSSKAGARFERAELRAAEQRAEQPSPDYQIEVRLERRMHQVLGFGGAFTDSALQVLAGLPERVRQRALADYFGADGLDYNMGRVPIGGTDMSERAYTYNDLAPGEEDLELRKFELQPEDLELKIPAIKQVNAMRGARQLAPLRLMAASWSAPAWMKSNRCLVQGRLLGNSSSAPYYGAYARYVVRFLHDYELKHNISMWALSAQNEPYSPKRVGPTRINFNSVNFEPAEMADYLANSLVPALRAAGKTPDKLGLFIWDDTLEGLHRYQEAALSSASVRDFALGLAIHWYSTGLNEQPYSRVRTVRRQLPPHMLLLSTEASFIGRPRPGEWARGQRYALDIIENLRAGSAGWLDWNLALNVSGGPTWSGNILDAAMLVDTERQVYLKNPMFYALGQVSRFVQPNSRVVHSQATALNRNQRDELNVVAAELDGGGEQAGRRVALVALNRAQQRRVARLRLPDCKLQADWPELQLELAANSITSLAFMC